MEQRKKTAGLIHDSALVADTHQEILDAYVYRFLELEQEAVAGDICVFDQVYLPLLRQQGVNFVNLSVGGDHVAQVMYSASELRFWDANKKLDILNTEQEAGRASFILCRSAADIDRAVQTDKIGIIATISGGRPLEGKPNLNLLSSLRNLYRLGLRSIQLTGNSRNRLGDGAGQARTRGRLTDFGIRVAREARRLNMVIDTAQLSDYGFFDLMEAAEGPVIDSHTGAAAVCDHPRNIGDERIKAIARSGGVIGISFWNALLTQDRDVATTDDILRHIDHVVNLAGEDHVALGPDYCAYDTPVDRDRIQGFSHLGPDACGFDRLTPVRGEKYPGFVEGVWYGIRKSDFVSGPDCHETFPRITTALIEHGFGKTLCRKILGENYLGVVRRVLGGAEEHLVR